ncbi:MAG TPA: response regulator transcription factor [Terriglobales bacterium]|nr:response regulator transcription factor [Terriglobales bacterium]
MDKIRLLLVSDYRLTRTGLRQMLVPVSDFEVAAETDNPGQATEIAQRTGVNVIILEITIPGPHGLRIAAQMVEEVPGGRVVVISSNENITYVRSMLTAGVLGYVLRKASDTELFLAIRNAYQGRRFIDPRLSDSLADVLLNKARGNNRASEGRLSQRELQVLRAITRGFTSQEVAQQLQLSTKTVETYRSRIYDKLGLKTRADLVHYAIAVGLLETEEPMA